MIKTFLARYLGLIILVSSKDVSIANKLHYFFEALGKTVDATDLATALTLVNELKLKLNTKLTADRNSGQQAT